MGPAEGQRAVFGLCESRGHSQVAGAFLPSRVLDPGAHRAAAARGAGDQRGFRGWPAIRRKRAGSGGRCEYRTPNIAFCGAGTWRWSIPAGGAGGEPASGSVRFSARSPAGHSPSSRAFPFSNPRQHLVRRMRAAPCANQSVRAIPNPWRSQAISGDFPEYAASGSRACCGAASSRGWRCAIAGRPDDRSPGSPP